MNPAEIREKFAGIYSALFTTYDEKGQMDSARLRDLIDFQLERGLRGAFIAGSTGEGLLLSEEERKVVAATAVDTLKGRGISIVHVGHMSTATACELARHAESVGADMVATLPPLYYAASTEDVVRHYQTIAASVSLPVLVYDISIRTGVRFTDEMWGRLFAIDNIVGMKYTGNDFYYLRNVIELLDGEALVLSGSDPLFLPALTMGVDGAIGTTENIAPEWFVKIQDRFAAGDIHQARELQYELNRLIKFWLAHGDLSAAKALASLRGVPAGDVRAPLAPLSPENEEALRAFAGRFFTSPVAK